MSCRHSTVGTIGNWSCSFCLKEEIERLTKKIELYDKALERKAMLEDDVVLLKRENDKLREQLRETEVL
jgi:hypothetical protein